MPTRPQSIFQEVSQSENRKQIDPSGHSGDSGTRLAWGCPHTHFKCPHVLQIPALHNTSRNTFSSMPSEPYISLNLDIMGHRGARPCQTDPREPREEPGMVLGSPKALTHGPLIPHTRTRGWSSPGASISQGWGQRLWQCQACSIIARRNALDHPQHNPGSEMHTTRSTSPHPAVEESCQDHHVQDL